MRNRCVYVYVCIYREREGDSYLCMYTSTSVCVYDVCIYIYMLHDESRNKTPLVLKRRLYVKSTPTFSQASQSKIHQFNCNSLHLWRILLASYVVSSNPFFPGFPFHVVSTTQDWVNRPHHLTFANEIPSSYLSMATLRSPAKS